MNIETIIKEEWTQEELFKYMNLLKKEGIEVIIVDTILKPLQNIATVTYNPYELLKYKKGSIFVFYCDTGKTTKERLSFYKKKFPEYYCISLRGGRGYWRPYYQALEDKNEEI